jgi:DNA ligase (NAD+)
MGTITPVAQVEPVLVSGAVITFASLANFDLIKQLDVNIGDVVEISRRGDVIPHIEKVVSKVNSGHLTAPDKCPSCQTPLIVESKFLKCPNSDTCPSQILGILRLFCSTLDIKGISLKTIQKLHASGVLQLPGDFYKLNIDHFKDLDGLGEKSGNNIIHQIQSKKTLTLQQIFTAAAIPDFSSARIQQLINAGFDTPQKILNLKVSDLEALAGFQNTLATKIIEGIAARIDIIQSILDQVTLESPDTSRQLLGMTFVITGELSRPRKDIINQLQSLGATVSASVSQNTDYLISNETKTNSSKFKTAQKLGTKIINETQLAQIILSLQTNS